MEAPWGSSDILMALIDAVNVKRSFLADSTGCSRQNFSARLSKNAFRTDEFLHFLDISGIDVKFVCRDIRKMSGTEGFGHPIEMMVEYEKVRTQNMKCLSSSFYEDGVNPYDAKGEATELYYYEKNGNYYIGHFYRDHPDDDAVTRIPSTEVGGVVLVSAQAAAEEYIKRYGPIEDKPLVPCDLDFEKIMKEYDPQRYSRKKQEKKPESEKK